MLVLLGLLGRLKLLYYYGTFGVPLGSLELTPGDQLFECWFVAQNMLFALLLWWIAVKTRAAWVAGVALAHALLPIATHYAFFFHDAALAAFLIDYRHTLMKLVPFAVLLLVWVFQPHQRRTLGSLTSPLPRAGHGLLLVLLLAWGISAAKHFGSFDANLAMRDPQQHLARVRLLISSEAAGLDLPRQAFLLHADDRSLVLWDSRGFDYGRTDQVRTLIVPREAVEWIEATRRFRVQPGNRLL